MRSDSRIGVLLVLGLIDAIGPLSIDLYVPSFPELQQDLRLTGLAVQLTLAAMTAGLALGQLIVGTLSDRLGRRRPLIFATVLYVAGTIACALAPSLQMLLVGRVTQGLGAAGGAVLVLAIIRDLSDGSRFVALLTRVTLITTTAPLLAPVVGALLLPVVGWRGLFGVLALLGLTLLVAVIALVPETLGRHSAAQAHRLRNVLRDRRFIAATAVGAAVYAGVYAYVAASPLLLRTVLGLDPLQFAGTFLVGSLALAAGVQIGGAISIRYSGRTVLLVAGSVALTAAITLVPAQQLGYLAIAPCLWLFTGACGACFPPAATIALQNQAAQAGTATSIYGFTTFAAAAVISPIPGLLHLTGTTPLAAVLVVTSAIIAVTALVALRTNPAQVRHPAELSDRSG